MYTDPSENEDTKKKAWNHRLADLDAYKNAIKEYTKALKPKNNRLGRIS
jgi:uncharacterized protein YaaR (DUF327 family)